LATVGFKLVFRLRAPTGRPTSAATNCVRLAARRQDSAG
jgi:hypothetical protein